MIAPVNILFLELATLLDDIPGGSFCIEQITFFRGSLYAHQTHANFQDKGCVCQSIRFYFSRRPSLLVEHIPISIFAQKSRKQSYFDGKKKRQMQ